MNRQDAERITTEYLKPIFGFALKRCHNTEDAEDLFDALVDSGLPDDPAIQCHQTDGEISMT